MVLSRIVSARVYEDVGEVDSLSICPRCNVAQAVLRFARIPFVTSAANPGNLLPSVELLLANGSVQVCDGLGSLLRELRQRHADLDRQLTPGQRAEAFAFHALVEEADRGRAWEWWVPTANYQTTRRAIAKHFAFPLSTILPANKRREVVKDLGPSADEGALYNLCEEAYSALEAQLGRHKYFFGDDPTTIDAVVYGYLAPVLAADLPNGRLKALLGSHLKLVKLLDYIREQHFVQDASKGFRVPTQTPQKPKHVEDLSPEAKATKRTSALFATAFLVTFFGYVIIQEHSFEVG